MAGVITARKPNTAGAYEVAGGDFSDYLLPDTNIMLIVVLYSMQQYIQGRGVYRDPQGSGYRTVKRE